MKTILGMKSSRQNWLLLGVSLLPLAFATPAIAADEAEQLDDVVVSAGRTATAASQVGSSVSVITAKDFEDAQATNALDVISKAAGITVTNNGGRGKATGLYIRGMGYKNILIMIDGIEVADPSGTQTAYSLSHLMADNIERVEILRGNQSSLYGSDAVAGVISITTKSGRGTGKLIEGSAGFEYGSFNTFKETASARGEYKGVYYSAGLTQYNTDGFDISHLDAGAEKDGYENTSADLRIGADLVKDHGVVDLLNLEVAGRYLYSKVETDDWDGWPKPLAARTAKDGDEETRKVERGGKIKMDVNLFDGMLDNSVAYSIAKTNRDMFEGNTRKNYYDGEKTKYEYKGVLRPLDGHRFVFGADEEKEEMDIYNIHDKSVSNTGFYGDYQIELFDKALTVTAGLRNDDHEMFGNETTYRTTASLQLPEGVRLHGSYGTGFRAPSLYELYSTYGKETMQPEKSRGYDIGFENTMFDDRAVLDVTFFNNRLINEIAFDMATYKYSNIASSRVYGVEVAFSADITEEWALTYNHTYQQTRNNSTSQQLGRRPAHAGNVRVDYRPDWLDGSGFWTSADYSGPTWDSATGSYNGGYVVWNLGANYEITDSISVYGRVENLTDKQYETCSTYDSAERSAYVGARFKF